MRCLPDIRNHLFHRPCLPTTPNKAYIHLTSSGMKILIRNTLIFIIRNSYVGKYLQASCRFLRTRHHNKTSKIHLWKDLISWKIHILLNTPNLMLMFHPRITTCTLQLSSSKRRTSPRHARTTAKLKNGRPSLTSLQTQSILPSLKISKHLSLNPTNRSKSTNTSKIITKATVNNREIFMRASEVSKSLISMSLNLQESRKSTNWST